MDRRHGPAGPAEVLLGIQGLVGDARIADRTAGVPGLDRGGKFQLQGLQPRRQSLGQGRRALLQRTNLLQPHPQLPQELDAKQRLAIFAAVVAVPVLQPLGAQQSLLFIKPDRGPVQPRGDLHLADGHTPTAFPLVVFSIRYKLTLQSSIFEKNYKIPGCVPAAGNCISYSAVSPVKARAAGPVMTTPWPVT